MSKSDQLTTDQIPLNSVIESNRNFIQGMNMRSIARTLHSSLIDVLLDIETDLMAIERRLAFNES